MVICRRKTVTFNFKVYALELCFIKKYVLELIILIAMLVLIYLSITFTDVLQFTLGLRKTMKSRSLHNIIEKPLKEISFMLMQK